MQTIKEYIAQRKEEIKEEVKNFPDIKLVIVQVGDVPASNAYIRGKMKDSAEVNIDCELIRLPEETTETDLLAEVDKLNKDDSVTGFIVQLPLPKHIREASVISAINPDKDVDGFSPLALVNPGTPQGMLDFLIANNIDFKDKNAVVIGRSNIVGKPMAKLLLEQNCNVTILHSKTSEENKRNFLAEADIIIAATGHRNIIDSTYVLKPSCIILDVGMNQNDLGKLCGDVEQDLPVAFKSPVPGGVGLLTRLALITNLMKLAKLK